MAKMLSVDSTAWRKSGKYLVSLSIGPNGSKNAEKIAFQDQDIIKPTIFFGRSEAKGSSLSLTDSLIPLIIPIIIGVPQDRA